MKQFIKVVCNTAELCQETYNEPWMAHCPVIKFMEDGEFIKAVISKTAAFFEIGDDQAANEWITLCEETMAAYRPKFQAAGTDYTEKILVWRGIVSFDDEFIRSMKSLRNELNDTGEFAFDYRRKLRKAWRDRIKQISDKTERNNKLDYMRWFC